MNISFKKAKSFLESSYLVFCDVGNVSLPPLNKEYYEVFSNDKKFVEIFVSDLGDYLPNGCFNYSPNYETWNVIGTLFDWNTDLINDFRIKCLSVFTMSQKEYENMKRNSISDSDEKSKKIEKIYDTDSDEKVAV